MCGDPFSWEAFRKCDQAVDVPRHRTFRRLSKGVLLSHAVHPTFHMGMSADISVIFVGEDGWTDMARDLPEERATSAHGFHKPWWKGVSLYHRNGYRYEVESATPNEDLPPLSKLMAATIHNPTFSVQYAYRSTGFYQLDELKMALQDAVDLDDDVLTQFHDADDLAARITAAKTFDDLVQVLEYARTEELEI